MDGAPPGTVAVRLLEARDARAMVTRIRTHLDQARTLLLEFYEREGWRALGYPNWQDCATAEFGTSKRAANYGLEAARVERELTQVGNHFPTADGMPLYDVDLRHIGALPVERRQEIARELASNLTIKGLRRLIAEKQSETRALAAARPIVQEPQAAGELVGDDLRWRIEVGDARALQLDDGEAQLIITSPPYNSRIAYPTYVDWLPWDQYWNELIAPALRECYRILCPGGRLCLNMPNVVRQDVGEGAHADVVYRSNGGRKWKPAGAEGRPWSVLVEAHLYPLMEQIGFLPRERIQWIKGADDSTVTTPSTAWGSYRSAQNPVLRAVGEPIYVFSKERYDRPDVGESDITAVEFMRDSRNVWFVPTVGIDPGVFPASFPPELPRRLARFYSFVDDLVVDPFLGAGTTVQAAVATNRRAYGCDIDPSSVALAVRRMSQ